MSEPITVVVAEDEFLTLEGICSLVAKQPDFELVGKASSGEEALSRVFDLNPQVLLLDIRMPPGIDGIEVIKRLRSKKQNLAIIALTQEYHLVKAVEEAGANGYVPKDDHHMFIPTMRCVVQTGSNVFINPKVSQAFQALQERVALAQLSSLEMNAWKLMNYKNEEIARRLGKSAGHIRNLITDLYFKLNIADDQKVSRRVQATELGRLLGILEEPEVLS